MTRSVLFVLGLARTRLTRRFGSVALAALGIAAGAATFAVVLGGGTVAQNESLDRALARLPGAQRAVRASWFGAYDPSLDRTALHALRGIERERPLRALLFRQTSVDGKVFNLGAADRLARWIRLRSGRLPHGCSPSRCEVVQVAGSGPLPDVPALRLRRVGIADLVSTVPFLQTSAYGRAVDESYAFTAPGLAPPFVLTNDVTAAARLPLFRLIHRSLGWILPLRPAAVDPWSIDELRRRVERARSELTTGSSFFEGSSFFDLSDPLSELEPAAEANRVTARRLLLVGGQATALLLAFVIVAAASRRREAELTRARLSRFGTRRWQIALLAAAEAAVVAALAVAIGWAIGVGIAAVVAAASGSPVGAVLAHSALSAGGVATAVALAAVAAGVLLLALHLPVVEVGRLSVGPLDVAAVGAAVAIAVALARGSVDATALSREGGTGVLLFLLPALIAFVAAVVAVRLLGPLARVLERFARRLPAAGRLAALSIARNPGYAGAVAAFLLVSVGFAAFAVNYRSTLARGQSDEARFQTPPEVVLRRTSAQPLPLTAPILAAAYRGAAEHTVPVLRLDAQVGSGAESQSLSLVGLPANAVRTLPFWRDDFSSRPLGQLAAAVDPGHPIRLRGVRLSPGARELTVSLRNRGDPLVATANVANRDRTFSRLELGTIEPGSSRIRVAVPAAARGGLLIGLGLAPTLPEVHGGRPASGSLTLGPFAAGGKTLTVDFGDWLGSGGIRVRGAGRTARLTFFLTNDRASAFRPRQETDGGPVAAIATPSLAAVAGRGGLLPVRIGDVNVVVRVGATAKRFPSTMGDFVVADEGALATALNSVAPGTAPVDEVWLEGVSRSKARRLTAALDQPPLAGVRATLRSRVEAGLRHDPLARAVLWTFATIALVAFVLALAGLALAVTGDLRDDRSELLDLEAQGAGPTALRRHVRLRAAAVVALGIVGGAVLGAALSALVVGAVLVTATGGVPEPPLVLDVDWPLIAAGLLAYVALAAVVVGVPTWRAFRGEAAA